LALLVVKEHWWAIPGNASLRSMQWAKPLAGKRTQMLDRLHVKERRISAGEDRTISVE
jgi:hypothetical protein